MSVANTTSDVNSICYTHVNFPLAVLLQSPLIYCSARKLVAHPVGSEDPIITVAPQVAATSTLIEYTIYLLQHRSQDVPEVQNRAFAPKAISSSILVEYLAFLRTNLRLRSEAINVALESLNHYFAWAMQNHLIHSDLSLNIQPLVIDPLEAPSTFPTRCATRICN